MWLRVHARARVRACVNVSLPAISDALVRNGSPVIAHVENFGAEKVKLQNFYCNVA